MNTEVVVGDTTFNIPENAYIMVPYRRKSRLRKITREEAETLHSQGTQVYVMTSPMYVESVWNFPDKVEDEWYEWYVEDTV